MTADGAQPRYADVLLPGGTRLRTHVGMWGAARAGTSPDASTGERQDVLLIHGGSSSIDVFRPSVIPGLSDRYRVAAYDRPGMGRTADRPPGAGRLRVQAEVAAGVIDALELKRPIIVAHSFGGAVALRLALDHPEQVGGLVLIAPVAFTWPGGVSWHLHWSANPLVGAVFNHVVTRPFAAAAVKAGMANAFAPSPVPERYFETAAVARAAEPRAMRANAHDITVLKREVTAQQARYASELRSPLAIMPISVLAGEEDSVVSTTIHARGLKAALPETRLEVLPGVGHLPHEARPDLLRELVDWVAEKAKQNAG